MKQVVRLNEGSELFGGNASFDDFGYAPAVKAGALLFIAGQVGMRADGSVPDDLDEEIERAFRRTGEILALEDLGFDSLVELVTYHVDVATQVERVRAIKDRFVSAPFPTWTIVGVAALALPSLRFEMKCVAAL